MDDIKKTGVEIIAEERATHPQRGFDIEHDAQHTDGAIADMAAIYACTHRETELRDLTIRQMIWGNAPTWPYEETRNADWFTPQPDRIKELAKAGALIAAEIDRLQNLSHG